MSGDKGANAAMKQNGPGAATRRNYSYDVLRLILAMLVVLGHSDFYQIRTAFGGIYIADWMQAAGINDTRFHEVLRTMVAAIYSFHMPAFIALSGALYEMKHSRYPSFRSLLSDKARNLLAPYFIVWLCWNIPIKWLSGYYDGIPMWKWFAQMAVPYDVYLWFLLSLFLVFAMSYILDHANGVTEGKRAAIKAVLFGAALVLQRLLGPYMPLGNPMKYLLWFELGRVLQRQGRLRQVIEGSTGRHKALILSVLAFAAMFIVSQKVSHFGWVIRDTVCPFCGVVAMWIISAGCAGRMSESSKNGVVRAARYTMGMFLYAEPINYLVLKKTMDWFGLAFFGTTAGAVAIFAGRILISGVIALIITKILMKLHLGVRLK